MKIFIILVLIIFSSNCATESNCMEKADKSFEDLCLQAIEVALSSQDESTPGYQSRVLNNSILVCLVRYQNYKKDQANCKNILRLQGI
ncbi:Hypothetical protein LBF_0424 [Leptospira biflexa serovar Patoc strain 'Patoc 1 (Ames)']|uniref:Lipoprotein n=1 Tax=Leptospira biflexa serovar Patoc (strain Patoc 1 / ATCC 23582 / Paris) TaxID=456481 RepID=B0SK06_LEPBP|nr:hypothetical protein [Leptospira biflexa]ABZ92967.1 Hypothetical protein LBF_0424 [Leptospira biflexa serovar Patoc strain 'Patoc 1 (Ames)']ABZ96582.1 Hypothetical protein; putative signal peptide [Leptospira biflexa serovar Patoc strain 'Patoc 1 (Paris)']